MTQNKGSITSDGGTRTFAWDGANRLVAINYTGFTTRSEFSYDGLSRMIKIVEKTGATIDSTRKFVWLGQEKLEFRDATDTVTQRNYEQGQYVGTTVYFYTRDHLGSIREMFTGGGTVVARYDYDPYGRSTTVLGTTPTDFNFTGLYRHSKSNLDLATYRAYDPDLGRWLSRDSLGGAELKQGPNLFAYVGDNPINRFDREGKSWTEILDDIWRMWEGSKCAKIIAKWKTNCFHKIPACSCEVSSSASNYELGDAIEQYAECVRQREVKWKECLKGMNQELVEEHCATVSF